MIPPKDLLLGDGVVKSSDVRMVRFLELRLEHGMGALHKQDWDLAGMFKVASGNNFYQRGVREGAKKTIRIKDYRELTVDGRSYAVLLFVLADAGFIDASYENMQTGVARTFNKDDGEGYRTEAHFVIDLEFSRKGSIQIYPAVLEESPGLGPSALISRLNQPLHKAGARSMKDPGGEEVVWYPIVAMDGLLSKSLIDEISKGELLAFDLVTESLESAGIDEPSELKRRRKTLHIDVVQSPEEGKVGHLISRARQIAFREDYEKVRISYREHDTGRQKTAVLDVPPDADDPSEAIEKLVSRTSKIQLSEPMNWDHDQVSETLAKEMILKLHSEKT